MRQGFDHRVKEKYLRILSFPSIILAVFVLGRGMAPAFALSDKEAVLAKLEQTAVNFHEVEDSIYRSGLISEEAAPLLKELGIKTVVNFDDNQKRAAKEEEFLKRFGIQTVSIPWSGWEEPSQEVMNKTLEFLNSPEAKPVLVHCKHGQERTGVAIACWRVANQGWSAEKAYQEMKAHGFRPFRYGHLKKYVYDFAQARGDQKASIENKAEQIKTSVLSFFYKLRKLNLVSFHHS